MGRELLSDLWAPRTIPSLPTWTKRFRQWKLNGVAPGAILILLFVLFCPAIGGRPDCGKSLEKTV